MKKIYTSLLIYIFSVFCFVFSTSAENLKPLPTSGTLTIMLGNSNIMPVTIYIPEGFGDKPLILVIHTSGGLQIADHHFAQALQKEGYLSVVPDFYTPYNLSPYKKRLTWTKFRENIHDDFTAIISQVRAMSKEPSRKVFAVGFSNGGYWAAALAAKGDVDAGVSYYGAYSEGGTVRGRAALKMGSIIGNTDSGSAPLLIFHGTRDRIVPLIVAKNIERLYPGVEARYYDGVSHRFENMSRHRGEYNHKAERYS